MNIENAPASVGKSAVFDVERDRFTRTQPCVVDDVQQHLSCFGSFFAAFLYDLVETGLDLIWCWQNSLCRLGFSATSALAFTLSCWPWIRRDESKLNSPIHQRMNVGAITLLS